MEGRPAFMQLIERNERRESLGPMRESSGMRPVRKIKVKALKGSPYVISLEKSDLVGEGSYGSVVRVFDLDHRDEELVAKVIPLDDKIKLAAIEAELRILIRLPLHPNLVNYKKIRVSSADKQYFIMEYCNGGTLNRLLNQSSPITNEEILDFLGQFSRGYKILYQSGIIHRDIKPENILIHNKFYKIADFGLAKIVDSLNIQSISAKGTPLYIAPELVRREKSSAKVDMWSLGVILYRLLFEGRFPFLVSSIDYDVQTALRHIQDKPLIIPESPKRPEELINLLRLMLEKDESKRISWEQFFENQLIYPYIQTEQTDQEDKLSSGSQKKSPYNPMKLYSSSRVIQVDKTEDVQQINMADSLESLDRFIPTNTIKELHKTADSTPKSSNSSSKGQFKDQSAQKDTNSAHSSQKDVNFTTPSKNGFLSDEKPSGQSAVQRIADSVRNIMNNGKRLLNIKEGLEKANEGTVHHKQVLKKQSDILGKEDENEEHLSIREKALFFDRIALRLMSMEDLLNVKKSLESILIQYLPMSQRATILLISAAQLVNSQLLSRITQKAIKQYNKPACSPQKAHKSSFSICSFDVNFNSATKNSHNQQLRNSSLITSTHSEKLKETTQPLSIMLLQDQQWLNTLKQDFIEESGPPDLDKKAYAKRISTLNAEQIARALTITVQAMTPLFEGIYKLSSEHSRGLLILFSYLLKAKELCLSDQPLEELSHCHQYWKFYEDIETKRSEEVLYNELMTQIHVEEHKKFQFLNDMRDNECKK